MKIFMKLLTKLFVAFCFFGIGTALKAQETIASSGGHASGSTGTVDYTIGQIFYSAITGTNGSFEQGVQQPFEIWVVPGIESTLYSGFDCSVFPNPATADVILKVDDFHLENLSYQLYDVNGKLFVSEKVTDRETTIRMMDLKPASYFLRVIAGNNEVKTFKINKK
jgi:hypothetical protein